MNVLVDINAGPAVAAALRGLGHDAAYVGDRDPTLPDDDILDWAVADGRLVVTLDKDFGELVYRSGRPHAGVLLLRLTAAGAGEKVQAVTDIFAQFAEQLPGKFAVYQDGRLRIR